MKRLKQWNVAQAHTYAVCGGGVQWKDAVST